MSILNMVSPLLLRQWDPDYIPALRRAIERPVAHRPCVGQLSPPSHQERAAAAAQAKRDQEAREAERSKEEKAACAANKALDRPSINGIPAWAARSMAARQKRAEASNRATDMKPCCEKTIREIGEKIVGCTVLQGVLIAAGWMDLIPSPSKIPQNLQFTIATIFSEFSTVILNRPGSDNQSESTSAALGVPHILQAAVAKLIDFEILNHPSGAENVFWTKLRSEVISLQAT